MGVLQAIYDRSPIALQNVMTTLSGYHRNSTRYGHVYWQHRRWLEHFDAWSLDDKLEYQAEELRRFLRFAVEQSPFYRTLYAAIDLDAIRSVPDLPRLPMVDKETLRANMAAVHTTSRRTAIEGHTGGTTGKSLVVLMTADDKKKRMAILDHFKHRVGFEHREMRRATFSGKHIVPPGRGADVFWRYNAACKQMLYSTFHITEDNLPAYVASLNSFKPQALDGFFTSMCDVANFIERHSVKLSFRPLAIFPTSETVTPGGRALLERVFNARVYNQYASSEGAPFITECQMGTLHVELSSGVFEHVDSDSDEILVTSFTTHGTPLIRYRIGDSVMFSERIDCPCGVSSPIVTSIEGRRDDFVYRADGAKINAGNVSNLFKNMPNALKRAQVVQEELSVVRILLQVDVELYRPEFDELLKDEFAHKFGPKTRLVIEHVDEIPREVSGKLRLIRNTLAGTA